jgi:hypothetical protein
MPGGSDPFGSFRIISEIYSIRKDLKGKNVSLDSGNILQGKILSVIACKTWI